MPRDFPAGNRKSDARGARLRQLQIWISVPQDQRSRVAGSIFDNRLKANHDQLSHAQLVVVVVVAVLAGERSR
jgi:hypothetical protein